VIFSNVCLLFVGYCGAGYPDSGSVADIHAALGMDFLLFLASLYYLKKYCGERRKDGMGGPDIQYTVCHEQISSLR
jgi:hypothetical protein